MSAAFHSQEQSGTVRKWAKARLTSLSQGQPWEDAG